MIDLDAIFAEPKVPIVAVIVPTRENPNSPEARRSAPTVPVESEVIEHNATSNATPANPFPCMGCGSAVFWLSAAGATTCPGCDPKPVDAIRKLLIVTIDGQNQWADFETEREAVRQRRGQVSETACIDDKST